MNPIVLISIIGSIASIVALLISAPSTKSKIIHIIYALILTAITGSSVLFIQDIEKEKNDKDTELEKLNSIDNRVNIIADSYNTYGEVGDNRGFILTSFAFLEKNKETFPETYEIAKELVMNGVKVAESAPNDNDTEWDERKRMKDGADAMLSLIKGLKSK